jgi:predicted  nucleic acid-binding Zn-ribbon protein
MKPKTGIIVLVVVAVVLLVALFAIKKQDENQHVKDATAILEFSNQLDTANINLNDLRQVNLMLTNDLESTRQTLTAASNTLAETSSQLAGAKVEIESDQNMITNLNGRIGDLETQNKTLDDRATMLSNNIVVLDAKIAATQRLLATAQTNNAFLSAELQKQMAEKAELERKFSDVDAVRAQLSKLRTELFEARRLEWMNAGVSPDRQQAKGAELLMKRTLPSGSPPATAQTQTSSPQRAAPYDLNVEVGSDGSVHVLPATPTSQDTAAQAAARAALMKEMNGTNAAPAH